MGETESRLASDGRKERAESGQRDGHVRLHEDTEAADGEDVREEKVVAKGELLVFVRYPETVAETPGSPQESNNFSHDSFRSLLRILQKCAPEWSISLEAKKTQDFAEHVTFHKQASATGQNSEFPIVNIAVIYAFDSLPRNRTHPPEVHGPVVAALNSALNPQRKNHVRIRWDVTTRETMERSALQLTGL